MNDVTCFGAGLNVETFELGGNDTFALDVNFKFGIGVGRLRDREGVSSQRRVICFQMTIRCQKAFPCRRIIEENDAMKRFAKL